MGQAIIRAAPDRDLYLVWSSIVDAPVAVGTRAEMVGWARQEWRLEEERAEAALVRAEHPIPSPAVLGRAVEQAVHQRR